MIGIGCILGRAPRTKETLPDFHEWCRVTRHPKIFRGLTGCQRTLGKWGVTIMAKLPDSFAQFVLDFRMDYIVSTILELVNVLKIAEGKVAEKKAKETISQGAYFYYGQDCHWKKNYKAYLKSKKKVACDASLFSGFCVIKD